MKNALFISMLGESEHVCNEDYITLCNSGKEKDWVVDWHRSIAENAGYKFLGTDICHEEKLPDTNNIDTVILGGTLHVITENRKWLHNLRNWLTDYRKTKKPLLAICGGHQMLSSQFADGELTKRPEGTLAGTYKIKLTEKGKTHPLFLDMPENPRFHFANYLHILPSISQKRDILAIHDNSPALAIDHGNNWFSTQFHPESRKQSWDIYYGLREKIYKSNYTEEHDGNILISNFFNLDKINH